MNIFTFISRRSWRETQESKIPIIQVMKVLQQQYMNAALKIAKNSISASYGNPEMLSFFEVLFSIFRSIRAL